MYEFTEVIGVFMLMLAALVVLLPATYLVSRVASLAYFRSKREFLKTLTNEGGSNGAQ